MDEALRKLIINALLSLNIPVNYEKYEGDEDVYITFFEYMQTVNSASDDEEDSTLHNIQLNLYYRGEIGDLQKQIINLLKAQYFTKDYIKDLGFDNETQRNWTAICMNYIENLI